MNLQSSKLTDFEIQSNLGQGSFSEVFKVKRKTDSKIYAMKKVMLGALKDKEKLNALNEVRILASIDDNYIISYHDAFIDEQSQSLCVIMEYAAEGDLANKISQHIRNGSHFQEKEIWIALNHISSGLSSLHKLNILHRDIKCANIFLSSNKHFKLGDLNVSKIAKKGLVYTQTGTPYYASPEVWRDEPYDQKSDIWSLGCVLYEMAMLKPPFRANDMDTLYKKVQKGLYEPLPNFYSQDLQQVISLMLTVSQKKRINSLEILQHPIVIKHVGQQHARTDSSINPSQLLQTILWPSNLNNMKVNLPKPKYDIQSKLSPVKSIVKTAQPQKRSNPQQNINREMQKMKTEPDLPEQNSKQNKYATIVMNNNLISIKPHLYSSENLLNLNLNLFQNQSSKVLHHHQLSSNFGAKPPTHHKNERSEKLEQNLYRPQSNILNPHKQKQEYKFDSNKLIIQNNSIVKPTQNSHAHKMSQNNKPVQPPPVVQQFAQSSIQTRPKKGPRRN